MKDEIYSKKLSPVPQFTFGQDVAVVFDDMANRSIPLYKEVHQLILQIIQYFIANQDQTDQIVIYDLGCSTGNTLFTIAQDLLFQEKNLKLIGIDNSPSMILRCLEKLGEFRPKLEFRDQSLSFLCADLMEFPLEEGASVILINYTLQFLSHSQKPLLLEKAYKALRPGGLLILCEKIEGHSPSMDELLVKLYYNFKKDQGYSELEILQKKDALENVLLPVSSEKLFALLQTAGFASMDFFFRYLNFLGILAIK